MTTKLPSYLILLEFTEQLRSKGWAIELTWVPRDANQAADDLTNEVWDRFNEKLRVTQGLDSFDWLVIPKLYPHALELYRETAEARAKAKVSLEARKREHLPPRAEGNRRLKSTRLSQPWDEAFTG